MCRLVKWQIDEKASHQKGPIEGKKQITIWTVKPNRFEGATTSDLMTLCLMALSIA